MRLCGWSHVSLQQIKDGGGRHLEFRKNVNNSRLDKDLHQIWCGDASRTCRDDHATKSRNRKSIRVTSSNKRPERKCVDLSDYNRYLNQILYIAHKLHFEHAGMCQIRLN